MGKFFVRTHWRFRRFLEIVILCGCALSTGHWLPQLRKPTCVAVATLFRIHVHGTTPLTAAFLAALAPPLTAGKSGWRATSAHKSSPCDDCGKGEHKEGHGRPSYVTWTGRSGAAQPPAKVELHCAPTYAGATCLDDVNFLALGWGVGQRSVR